MIFYYVIGATIKEGKKHASKKFLEGVAVVSFICRFICR